MSFSDKKTEKSSTDCGMSKKSQNDWHGMRFEKFVPSEIDLAPCFVLPNVTPNEVGYYADGSFKRDEGSYARIAVMQLCDPEQAIDGKSELWRVCIWGADDLGYENDVPTMTDALAIYNSIDWVYGLPKGFRYA